jgi:NADPH:quinone reductase
MGQRVSWPAMATVVIAPQYGEPEILTFIDEVPAPPGPGESTLSIRAAGVNPADIKSYSGAFGTDPAELPKRLGFEAAGVVTAVGPDAVGPAGPIRVGDEVIAFRVNGSYASEITVAAQSLVPKPAGLSWEQAAGLMLTGATAFHLLKATEVAAGDTVLIHGASGGVGLMAVQLALGRGARVIATASASKHDQLRTLGAEPVAYGPGLSNRVRGLAGDGVDVALDTAGTDEAVDTSIELVADRNRIATIAAFARGAAAGIKVLGGGPGADPGTEIRDAARLELAREAEAGRLQVFVSATFPLSDVVAAHRALLDRRGSGKIILVP